jgi:hypothetical protein
MGMGKDVEPRDDARCCCGHAFEWHRKRAPHACTDCVCVEFQTPIAGGNGWRTSFAEPEGVHLAALKEPQGGRVRRLEALGREGFGFEANRGGAR